MDNKELNQIDTLIKVINSLEKILKKINENIGKKQKTILLLGNTGSGKSTIFNWISGAKFKYEDEKLILIEEFGKNYSTQGDDLESITFEPNFNVIDDEYILIDFPGFKDTKGAQNQLSIQLMFNEVVTSTEVKLAVVIEQHSGKIPQRGSRILELVQNTFSSQNAKFDSIGLILNKFGDKKFKEDESLKKFVKKQLEEVHQEQKENKDVYRALQENIMIIRKIGSQNCVFNDEQRKSLIEQLKSIKPIQYQPDKVDQDQIVSDYIGTKLNRYFFQYRKSLTQKKDDAKKNGSVPQFNNSLKEIITQIGQIKFEDLNSVVEWMNKNILLDLKKDETIEKFLQIFRFFFKYQACIEGFKTFKENISEIKQIVEGIISEIQAEIQRIQDEEARFRRRQEEEKRKHNQYLEQLRREQAEEQRRRKEELKQRKEEEEKKAEDIRKNQLKLEQELKEKKARDLEIQKKIEQDRKIQEQKQQQQLEEQKKKQQEKNALITKLENCKLQIRQLNQNKNDYISSQEGLYMTVWGGDASSVYNQKIYSFQQSINKEEQKKRELEKEILYY